MAIKIDTQCEWILHVQDEPERAAVRATVRATVRASINAVLGLHFGQSLLNK